MATKSFDFQMDLIDKIPTIPISLVQGDVQSNIFNITLTKEGLPIDLTGSNITITMKKPDNNVVVGQCVITDALKGIVQYTCGTNDIAAAGTVYFAIEIYVGVARVSTTQGKFKVIAELDNGSSIESTTEYSVLTTLINNVNTSENTRVTNENARINAEGDATKGRVKAENDRAAAETIRQNNENTRINQENTRQSNETTRQNNESTRQSNETNRESVINAFKVNEPYDPNHNYVPFNKVTYQGSSYINTVACKGVSPTNTTNWFCIASKGLDGTGAGDMVKAIYDTDGDGIVDYAEIANSVEWLNVQNKPNLAEKTYVDEQIQTVTATGIPKLVSFHYDLYATVDNQTKFDIPYDQFNKDTDTLLVTFDGSWRPQSDYTVTNPVVNGDSSITKGYITLVVGRPKDSYIGLMILKNVPIGPDGAIQGTVLATNSIPQNRVQGLADLQDDIKKTNGTVIPTVAYGMNSKITNDSLTSVSPKFTIQGQNHTNLLGKDGNCEDTTKWNIWQLTQSLDSSNKVFGLNGMKLTLTSTSGTFYKGIFSSLDVTKYYLISAYLKNGNATNVILEKDNTNGGITYDSTAITTTTSFTRVGLIVQPSDLNSANNVAIRMNGSSGQYAYVDGIMINQITSSEYALGVSALLAKYPYVDSYSCLQNPYIEVRHDNLVRNGNGEEGIAWWTPRYASTTFSIEDNKFKVTNSSGTNGCYQVIKVKPNTNYYIQGNITNGTVGGTVWAFSPSFSSQLSSGSSGTFNSGSFDEVWVYIRAEGTGYAYFDSIMLVEGTTPPTQYLPCRIERCVIEGKFTSDDSITYNNGEVTGLINWKHKTLFGKDYDCQYGNDYTGYKYVKIPTSSLPNVYVNSPTNAETGNMTTKYDGKILNQQSSFSTYGADCFNLESDYFAITIADTDTGWTESINPNNDEAKAFMNGWKAISYTGSRYVCWISLLDASVPQGAKYSTIATGGTGTVFTVADASKFTSGRAFAVYSVTGSYKTYQTATISGNTLTFGSSFTCATGDYVIQTDDGSTDISLLTWCKNNVAPNYEGYQLHYKLANPEPITDANTHIHGDIPKFDVGDNYLYLDSGMVLGEVANPMTDSTNYFVNSSYTGYESSKLKNKDELINAIYKNNIFDTKWIIQSTTLNVYGNAKAYVPNADFNTNAIYTVDYKILATIAPQIGTIGCSYSQDIVSAINTLSEEIENKQNHDSTLDNIVDLSLYETISVPGLYYTGCNTASNCIQITLWIPFSIKKAIPTVTVTGVSYMYFNGTVSAALTNNTSISITSITTKGCRVVIQYTGTDSTMRNNMINYGWGASAINLVVDCRGRI